jgi:hypothetical protein
MISFHRHHFAFAADIDAGSLHIYADGILVWNDTQVGTDYQVMLIQY